MNARNTILLVLPLTTDLGREMFLGAQQALVGPEHRFHWQLTDATPEYLALPLHNRPFLDRLAGIIAFAYLPTMETALLRCGRPVVNLSGRLEHPRLPTVSSDNRRVGQLAAEHLAAIGLQHFAFVGTTHTRFSFERHAGFQAELKRLQRAAPRHIVPESLHGLFELPCPCGVFCADDRLAAEVVNVVTDGQRRVPHDCAVLGCDNETIRCLTAAVPVSSINLNGRAIGAAAARLLLAILAGQRPPTAPVLIPPGEVVIRDSTNLIVGADERLTTALAVIRNRACEPLTVSALADHLHIHRRTLERLFRQELGRNIRAEILRVRLQHACDLLRHSDLAVSQVATQAGFLDYGRFTRVFRRQIGATPTGYRRQFRQGV
jgi:LacI family transcriptional regulator